MQSTPSVTLATAASAQNRVRPKITKIQPVHLLHTYAVSHVEDMDTRLITMLRPFPPSSLAYDRMSKFELELNQIPTRNTQGYGMGRVTEARRVTKVGTT